MKYPLFSLLLLPLSLFSGAIGTLGVLYVAPTFIDIPLSLDKNRDSDIGKIHSPSSLSGAQNIPLVSQDITSLEKNITQTVARTSSSIVSIVISKDLVVYRSDPWGFFQQPSGTISRQVGGGSGFFIRKDGMILTNKHVVVDPEAQYTVILNDGSEYAATVRALDPVNDLAVIQITPREKDQTFTTLPLINDIHDIVSGQFVIAVGNALAEFQNSVSLGIVSGKERSIDAGGIQLSGLIQTDAAINPGNSGGPLLNLSGSVIGINTAIASGSNGIGFAFGLTQSRIDYILKSLEESGRIKRPFIGINYIPNSSGVASELGLKVDYGVYIIDEAESIVAGSSAQKAGMSPGDIILEVAGKRASGELFNNIIQNSLPGENISLKILKKSGEEKTVEIELGEY